MSRARHKSCVPRAIPVGDGVTFAVIEPWTRTSRGWRTQRRACDLSFEVEPARRRFLRFSASKRGKKVIDTWQ